MNRHKLYYTSILLLCILAISGCNDTVFIDDDDLSSDYTEVEIEGDGGEATLTVSTKDLLNISIDYFGRTPYKYYNANGEEIPENSPASELYRIAGHFTMQDFEVVKTGNKLTFRSVENCLLTDDNITIRLEYTYTTKFIHLRILKGKPLQLVNTVYTTTEPEVNDMADMRTSTYRFTNNGPIDQIFEVRPYLTGHHTLSVIVEEGWAKHISVNIPVLWYIGNEWGFKDQGLRLGNDYDWTPYNYNTTVNVSIPANSTAKITAIQCYTSAKAEGVITFRKPVTGTELTTRFVCISKFPYKYDIKVDEVN